MNAERSEEESNEDLARSATLMRAIPPPAGENAGVRDDASEKELQTEPLPCGRLMSFGVPTARTNAGVEGFVLL